MDIYEEIVNLLGLNSQPNSLEDIEQKLLSELNDLNETYRSLDNQITETQEQLQDLREKTANCNQNAVKHVRKGNEEEARRALERKEDAMRKIEDTEQTLSDLRRHIEKVEDRRSALESKLAEIRRQKADQVN